MKPDCFKFWKAGFYVLLGHFYLITLVGVPILIGLAGALTLAQGAGVAAFLAAIAMFGAVDGSRSKNCGWEGNEQACWAGVVASVTPAYGGGTLEVLLPWNVMHDRVDVVVKSAHWPRMIDVPIITQVVCNDDALESPLAHCFYFSSKVCGAALGATIGAGAAIAPAVVAGILIALAITCATVILCLFALIAAALVAAVVVLAGAAAGSYIGGALAPDGNFSDASGHLGVGDYVSLTGKASGIVKDSDTHQHSAQNPFTHYGSTKIMYFVEDTVVHGRSFVGSPFTFVDPDIHLVQDACPVVQRLK